MSPCPAAEELQALGPVAPPPPAQAPVPAGRPPVRRRRRWVGWGALGLALLAAWRLGASAPSRGEETRDVRRGELVFEVEIAGALEAEDTEVIGPPVSPRQWDFKIERMAPEGEAVAAGDVVLAFDVSQLDRQLQEALASHEQAAKELEKRRIDFELRRNQEQLRLAEAVGRLRVKALEVAVPAELVGSLELERARLDRELAEGEERFRRERLAAIAEQERAELTSLRQQRDRAAARVAELRAAIAAMQVKAPRAGPVIYLADWQGDKRKIGDSVWRGQSVLEIPDLATLRGRGEADEADSGRVAEGQPVRLRLDAFPDEELRGRVAAVESTVQRRSPRDPVKVVSLEIALEGADPERFRPGMRFSGVVEVERSEPLLLVPAAAVFPAPEGALVYRRRATGGLEVVRPQLGRRDGKYFEVLSGLGAGDRVSTRPPLEGAR
jgi:HlyD family secretion protein